MVKLSFYKLVQFLKEYINPEGIKTHVLIRSCIAQTWLCKLRFIYKELRKDIFIDGHEQPDVVEDQNCFLIKIKELKPYMVEFNEDSAMKAKNYPVDCIVGGEKHRSIIVIIHDEYIFSAMNKVRKVWT